MLLWRSSKLTDGRKSRGPVDLPVESLSPFRLKEKSEWLLDEDALSIGALWKTKPGVEAGWLERLCWALLLHGAIEAISVLDVDAVGGQGRRRGRR